MTESLLSNRVTSMTESATIRMAQTARDLRDKGIDVISLSLGEPDFDTPEHIKEAAKKALDDGYTKYSPVPGFPQVREAICKKLKETNKLEYTTDQIVISNGAKQSIANVVLALVNKGDEVVLFAPYWVSYSAIAKMAGGVPIELKAGIEQDYKVSAQQLNEALNEKSKLIIFSSPCNPSGSVYTYEELSDIADVLEKYPHVCTISDEIYEYINFTGGHYSLARFSKIKDRVATINGFSKGFAMTGWRLGYMAGPQWLTKACSKIQGQFTSGACSFSQMASIEALEGDMEPTEHMRQAFDTRRKIIGKLISEIPGFKANDPKGAFYIFPDVSSLFGKTSGDFKIYNSDDLCEYLLHNAHVAIVTGSAFGSPECVRISYASSEAELREALGRIKSAVEKLS